MLKKQLREVLIKIRQLQTRFLVLWKLRLQFDSATVKFAFLAKLLLVVP